MRIDQSMTPKEAAVWWRAQARKEPGEVKKIASCKRISVRAILQYVEPPKRKPEIYQDEECLWEYYKQGRLIGGKR